MDWLMITVMFAALLGIGRLALWLFAGFFDTLDAQRKKHGDNNARVLLFGVSETACELAGLLEGLSIDYLQIENESRLDRGNTFTHLAALSDSDLDNLMMSRFAERMMNIRLQIIQCNEIRNDGIFKKNGAPYFYKRECPAGEILRRMFPVAGKEPEVASND